MADARVRGLWGPAPGYQKAGVARQWTRVQSEEAAISPGRDSGLLDSNGTVKDYETFEVRVTAFFIVIWGSRMGSMFWFRCEMSARVPCV